MTIVGLPGMCRVRCVAIVPVVGTTTFLVMCSERVSRQWELAAATDFLTGLPNRRTIIGTGEARLNAARRKQTGFALRQTHRVISTLHRAFFYRYCESTR